MLMFKDFCIAALVLALTIILLRLRKVSGQVYVNLPMQLGWFEGFASQNGATTMMMSALYAAKTHGLLLERTTLTNNTITACFTDAQKSNPTTIVFVAGRKVAGKLTRHFHELLQLEKFKEFRQ